MDEPISKNANGAMSTSFDESLVGNQVGQYRLVERLGSGGTGVVYRATQTDGQIVAIKILKSSEFTDTSRAAWIRESRLVGRLSHPNLIKILAASSDHKVDFCVFEWAAKGSLADLLRMQLLDFRQAAEIASSIALGCQALHDHHFLHRDIKPSNVLIDASGVIKLADFGAARAVDETVITNSHTCIGTPGYMSPEQMGLIDAAMACPSDVYSIGAVLYAMLVGRGPFSGVSTIEIIAKAARGHITNPSELRSVPLALEAICLKCLKHSPTERYPTAQALYEDLQRFLSGSSVSAFDCSTAKLTRRRLSIAAIVVACVSILGVSIVYREFQNRVSVLVSPEPSQTEEKSIAMVSKLGGTIGKRDDQIVAVDLTGTQASDDDLAVLNGFPHLEAVMLGGTQVSICGIEKIPDSVRRIDLSGNVIGDADCAVLAKRQNLKSICFLENAIRDTGVKQLCASGQLTELTLQGTLITDACINDLLKCEGLESLVLNGTPSLSASAIANFAKLKKLQYLHLGSTAVNDEVIGLIVKNCQLKEIGLCNCVYITDAALNSLANCPSLETVFLDGSSVTADGVRQLARLPKLKKVFCRGNGFNSAFSREEFRKSVLFVDHW